MTGLTDDELSHLVQMATCAPSVHNTQPWRFVPGPDGILLKADRGRQLAVIDPEGRELLISCGAALHHLRVAARALGLDADVTLLPQPAAEGSVALVRLDRGAPATEEEIDSAVAILYRHTHRGRFDDAAVPQDVLDELAQVVEAWGGALRVVREDELLGVRVLVSRAEQSLQQSRAYGEELAHWVWHDSRDAGRGDGIPSEALDSGTGRAESVQGRRFDGGRPVQPREPASAERPSVVLVSTQADTPHDWVRAGEALSAMLLRATEHGILAQPLGQVIDVPAARAALKQVLGITGAPQMLLRLGPGVSLPTSPRRPVHEFLDA